MTFLPTLREIRRERTMTGGFAGYNANERIRESELRHTQNLSLAALPGLAPRARRAKVRFFGRPNGLFAHDRLCWADGERFFYDGEMIGDVENSRKRFARMGARVLIFPDKKMYDAETGAFTPLEACYVSQGTLTAYLCRADGAPYDCAVSDTAPDEPADGACWLDTSGDADALKVYSAAQALWTGVASVYTKLSAPGIGEGFSAGDGVSIAGVADGALNGDFLLERVEADALVITAVIRQAVSQSAPVTIRRSVPDMDFICECNNRLWGCSSQNHEIYASKLGDPTNWHVFAGLSTDSYAATVGSGGDFTGCVAHLGYVLFFKETCIHKLYGAEPSNFQLADLCARGVAAGCERSAVVVNETLYYRSRADVCAYAAALPQGVSDALGLTPYDSAVAGALGRELYISMRNGEAWTLFCYDTQRDRWLRVDDTHALCFAAWGGDLYYIDAADQCLYSMKGNLTDYADGGAAMEADFLWGFETGDIGMDAPDAKRLSGVQLALKAESGAVLRVQACYDGSGTWEDVYMLTSDAERQLPGVAFDGVANVCALPLLRMFTLPLYTPRCNTMRLKVSAIGRAWIHSIAKTVEAGSDADVR